MAESEDIVLCITSANRDFIEIIERAARPDTEYSWEVKAKELFLSACTDEQVKTHNASKEIVVIGSETGDEYTIETGLYTSGNIWSNTARYCMWAGDSSWPRYDVFLAQKLMIETMEEEFLRGANTLSDPRDACDHIADFGVSVAEATEALRSLGESAVWRGQWTETGRYHWIDCDRYSREEAYLNSVSLASGPPLCVIEEDRLNRADWTPRVGEPRIRGDLLYDIQVWLNDGVDTPPRRNLDDLLRNHERAVGVYMEPTSIGSATTTRFDLSDLSHGEVSSLRRAVYAIDRNARIEVMAAGVLP